MINFISIKPLKLFLLFIFIISSSQIFSIPNPMKFGNVDKSLLEMKVYDKDTSADAVIVCDFGEFDANMLQFTRLYRLKVLKKSGCDRGNFIMNVQGKSNFSGYTYNLVNGEIVKEKLKSESIFEERITNNYYRYRLTMPDVQVGSVIDIKVYLNGIPDEWYFQSDIPVIWSELRLPNCSTVGIKKNYFGFQPITIIEDDRWVCKDMPALKKEPFMNNLDNFLTKFEIDVTSFRGFSFANTWNEVNDILLDRTTFGDELKTSFFMGSEADAINDSCKTTKAKMVAAYETIKSKIKWNEDENIFPKSTIKYALHKGSGNAGEINIALILLLRKLGIECYPIVLSTRDNGLLPLFSPTINKLNYLVVLAKINSEDILLDATEEFLPAGYLPERCINGNGRLVDSKVSIWTGLKPGGKNLTRLYADLSLNDKGNITGNLFYSYYEYAGYLFRKDYATFNDKNEYIRNYVRENPGMQVVNSTIHALDSIYDPLIAKYEIENYGNTDITDSTLSFVPFLVDRIKINPFKSDERKIPVDFINPNEKKYIFKIKIPENYTVEHMPESINLILPDNSGKFTFRVSFLNNIIVVQSEISLYKALYTQAEYPYIKQLYAEIVNKQSEPIILKKK